MQNFITIIVALIFLFLPQNAWSCRAAGINPERIPEVLESAVFIGKVEVLEIKEFKGEEPWDRRWEILLQPVQAYKGSLDQPFVVKDACCFSCTKGLVSEGTIYEEIVFSGRDGSYRLSTQLDLFPEDVWEGLRKEAKQSPLLEEKERECIKEGNILVTHTFSFVNAIDCHRLADDAGKNCTSSSQCQGLCLAQHVEPDGKSMPFYYRRTNRNYIFPSLPGKCSPWRDMDGCYHEVIKGKIADRECAYLNSKKRFWEFLK